MTVTRARKIQRFLSQPFFVAEVFTGVPGIFVPIDETVESFEALVNGDLDDVPEQAFLNVGGVESVLAKAKTLAGRGRLVADGVFGVEVVTPEQSLVAGGATAVVLATSEGDLTVLDGHTPLVGDVVPVPGQGRAARRDAGPSGRPRRVPAGRHQRRCGRGAGRGRRPLPGLSTRVTVLAGIAELAEEIDVPRAEQARDAARGQRVGELARRGEGASDLSAGCSDDRELAEAERALAPGRAAAAPQRGRVGRRMTRSQANETELNSESLASAWLASILRTVPDFERMTSDWVVAPNSW